MAAKFPWAGWVVFIPAARPPPQRPTPVTELYCEQCSYSCLNKASLNKHFSDEHEGLPVSFEEVVISCRPNRTGLLGSRGELGAFAWFPDQRELPSFGSVKQFGVASFNPLHTHFCFIKHTTKFSLDWQFRYAKIQGTLHFAFRFFTVWHCCWYSVDMQFNRGVDEHYVSIWLAVAFSFITGVQSCKRLG